MVVVTQTHISRQEYAKTILKLTYRRAFTKLLLAAGIWSLIALLLNWFHWANFFDTNLPILPFCLVFGNILYPFMIYGSLQKQYDTYKRLQIPTEYTFDDEKISYSMEGAEGYLSWIYLLKYETVNNFLILHVGLSQAYFVKTDKLTDEELKFITSKIKPSED